MPELAAGELVQDNGQIIRFQTVVSVDSILYLNVGSTPTSGDMKIDELIKELKAVQEEHGNLEVIPAENRASASLEIGGVSVDERKQEAYFLG